MAKLVFKIDDSRAVEKLQLLQSAAANPQPVYATVGRVLVNRIRLCFKLGIDPWNSPWQAIKWRSPRVRMQAIKNKAGEVIDYKRKIGKDGRPILTKYGQKQIEANKAGKPGQPLRDTGRLQRSISSQVDSQGVTVGTNVKYARTHQFGATIVPKAAKRLAFPGPNGEIIFAKKVVVPARPFMPLRRDAQVALPADWALLALRSIKAYLQTAASGRKE